MHRMGVGSVSGMQQSPTKGQMPLRRSVSSFIQQVFAEIVWQALGGVLLILTDHLPGKRWSQVAGSCNQV